MDNTIRTFKEVFPDIDTSLTPEQIAFAQGGKWKPDSRSRHINTPEEWDEALPTQQGHEMTILGK